MAAAGNGAGRARQAGAGVGGGAGRRLGRCPPRLAAASRNLQGGSRAWRWGRGRLAGRWGPGPAKRGSPGRKCWEGRQGEGRAAGPGAPRPPLCAVSRVAAGAVACLPDSPDSDLASPGRARSGGAGSADGEISRSGASAEPIFIRPGDVSSASRGLLSMESGARDGLRGRGAGRAQPRIRRGGGGRGGASPPPPQSSAFPLAGPAGPLAVSPSHPALVPARPGPGLPSAHLLWSAGSSSFPHRFALRYCYSSNPSPLRWAG